MARIALTAIGAIAGFLIAGPVGLGLGVQATMAAVSIGMTVGGIVGSVLFPPNLGNQEGPRLNDLSVSSSANGAGIPFGYGKQRLGGNVIWSPGLVEHKKVEKHSAKGGPSYTTTTYTYTCSFAAAFGEGVGKIRKVWFDSKVVYDVSGEPAANVDSIQVTPVTITGWAADGTGVFSRTNAQLSDPIITKSGLSGLMFNTHPKQLLPGDPHDSGDEALPFKHHIMTAYGTWAGDESLAPLGKPNRNFDMIIEAKFVVSVAGDYTFKAFSDDGYFVGIGAEESSGNLPTLVSGSKIGTPQQTPKNHYPVLWGMNQAQDYKKSGRDGQAAVVHFPSPGYYRFEICYSEGKGGEAQFSLVQGDAGKNWYGYSVIKPQQGNAMPPVPAPDFTNHSKYPGPTIYPGSQDQMPDPSIQADQGVDRTPAFRGLIYCVWEDFVLTDFGNRIPNIRAEVEFGTIGGSTEIVLNPGTPRWGGTVYTFGSKAYEFVEQFGAVDIYRPYTADLTLRGDFSQWQCLDGTRMMFWYALKPVPGGYAPSTPRYYTDNLPLPPGTKVAVTDVNGCTNLAAITTDICKRAGLTEDDIDVSQLVPYSCLGYVIPRPSPARNCLIPLATAFFFDVVESDGKVKCVPRGAAPVMTIPDKDLGLASDNGKLAEQITQEQELPREVQILFADPDLDYQQNKTSKRRSSRTVQTLNQSIVELPLVMDKDFARQVAEKMLYLAYRERRPFDINTYSMTYSVLDPTDVVSFVYDGMEFQMRLVKTSLGAGYAVQLSGVSEDARAYLSNAVGSGDSDYQGGLLPPLSPTMFWLFDLPLLVDTDATPNGTGFYMALGSPVPTWTGGVLYKSTNDAAFDSEASGTTSVAFGTAVNQLGVPLSPYSWDKRNRLTVQMANGSLSSADDVSVLNGSNVLVVGNEVIQFRDAVQNEDGSYTLSNLLRGRRGTEWACGSHAAGEAVINPLSGTFRRVSAPLSGLNQLRYYRGVTVGQDITSVASQQFTMTGADLKPYSPVHISGTRNADNLTISWVRRTRINGDWHDFTEEVPLSEDFEKYDVEVLKNGSVVRTFSGLTSPTVTYSAADQTADFGSPQNSVSINVYQLSAQVGRGFPGTATV